LLLLNPVMNAICRVIDESKHRFERVAIAKVKILAVCAWLDQADLPPEKVSQRVSNKCEERKNKPKLFSERLQRKKHARVILKGEPRDKFAQSALNQAAKKAYLSWHYDPERCPAPTGH
jgi:hypothetical protein